MRCVDGGYADYMVAPAEAVVRIPEGLSQVEAGPLMCAGITTYNVRNSGAKPGDLVAIPRDRRVARDHLSTPLVLVAKPELRGNGYSATILVVRPLGGDAHVGFIVNRPTGASLGELFPGHAQSQKLVDPVYSGGPCMTNLHGVDLRAR